MKEHRARLTRACALILHFEYLLLAFISSRLCVCVGQRTRYIFMEMRLEGGGGDKLGKYRTDSLLGRFMCRFEFALRTKSNYLFSNAPPLTNESSYRDRPPPPPLLYISLYASWTRRFLLIQSFISRVEHHQTRVGIARSLFNELYLFELDLDYWCQRDLLDWFHAILKLNLSIGNDPDFLISIKYRRSSIMSTKSSCPLRYTSG